MPFDIQSECRKKQMENIQKSESKQLRILFGVCILFVLCHTCRIVLNLEDLYLRLVKETDPTKLRSCNVGCASTYSMLSHVSLNTNSLQYIFIM